MIKYHSKHQIYFPKGLVSQALMINPNKITGIMYLVISKIDEYAVKAQYGPGVPSPIAGATKMFWETRQLKS